MAIFSGVLWLGAALLVPETYAPVLLRQRARKLSKISGKVYRSHIDIKQGPTTAGDAFKTALSRPWLLLFREPIIIILSIYMAIIYGTLYMLFGAYPIVYQQQRGWSEGISGLAFIGVAIGMVFAIIYSIFFDNRRYQRVTDGSGGFASPEARLHGVIVGGCVLPIGLFWFSWTNSPSLPWAASMAAGIPFGFGMVLVFLGLMNYLIDAYTIFAASVLAANSVLRSCFGAAFPLFTSQMYSRLGKFTFDIYANIVTCTNLSRHSLGFLHSCFPRLSMRTFPLSLLQVRRFYPHALQVCRRGGCIHEKFTRPKRSKRPKRKLGG